MRTVLRNARLVGGSDHPVTVSLVDGVISAIGPSGGDDGTVFDLEGRFLMRGLWDEHVHFEQWTLAGERLDLGGAETAARVCELVGDRIRASPEASFPLMGTGYREAAWPDLPTRSALDRVSGNRPVALVGMDMHSAWLNSAAFAHYGVEPSEDGFVRETDFYRIVPLLNATPDDVLIPLMRSAAERASARGLVGMVELEMVRTFDVWPERYAAGITGLRIDCGVYPQYLDEVLARGWQTGHVLPETDGRIRVGPLKIVTDGSLNTLTAYCWEPYPGASSTSGVIVVPPDELIPLLRRAREGGMFVAVHAIGDRANTLALDAFEATGAPGRIEHAQLLKPADVPRFASLGVQVSAQPAHAVIDRDIADRLWHGWTDRSFPLRTLWDAGVDVVFGSDAPCAPLDPWLTIAAAVHRSLDEREPWHPEQEVTIEQALDASTRGRYRVEVGDAGDLVVLDVNPLRAPVDALANMKPAGTMVGGRWTFGFER